MTSILVRPLILLAAVAPTLLAVPAVAEPTPSPALPAAVLIVHVDPSQSIAAASNLVAGATVHHRFGALHAFSVRVPATKAAAEASRLAALPGVTAVESGVVRRFGGTPTNDPYYGTRQQTYLGPLRAADAWAGVHPQRAAKIAILDSGVDVTHPDLGNGRVTATHNAYDGSTNVTDALGHGTFVAGVAAAQTGNGLGVAGAAANDAVIYAVKIADPAGGIQIDDEVAGIRWATAQHVDVINLSLGGPDRSAAEADAIGDAQRAGIVVVAAAGNDGDTAPSYPAAYPGVLAVGATDPAHRTRAVFSNHGSWVDVAAPGVSIFSTVPRTSDMWGSVANRYTSGDGTSFSTPLVAGEAGLLRAQNPNTTVAQVRQAITASAHGYGRLGLGRGQVDLAAALDHLPPLSRPTTITTTGAGGIVRLAAASTARRVAFRIDDEPRLPSVPASLGSADQSFATWGFTNGTHELRAYDCTAFDECSYAARTTSFQVDNPAPSITSPVGGAGVTGNVTVRATSNTGGPLRLLVDGKVRAVDDTAPYAFTVSSSTLTNGPRVLRVQGCSRDHRHCAGPLSAAVAVNARGLHPSITSITPSHVSPNADGVRDKAAVTFRLPERDTVVVRVLDANARVLRSYRLGTLAAGRHSWTWRPAAADGTRLPDGRYQIALDTTAGSRRGWVTALAVVDTRRPALAAPTASGARIYPARDGFRDALIIRTRLGESGRLVLTVRSAAGKVVRTVGVAHPAGPATIAWNGRTAHGSQLPAGSYRWQLALTDAAGNTTHSAVRAVTVSAKRLVAVTDYVTKPAASVMDAGGTSRCATAKAAASRYGGGLDLVNGCPAEDFDLAYADYAFRLPVAVRYVGIGFQIRGVAVGRRAELSAAFTRTDGSVEIPNYVTIAPAAVGWHGIGGVPAADHLDTGRRTRVSLLLDSTYAGRNGFDTALVRLRVKMTVLR